MTTAIAPESAPVTTDMPKGNEILGEAVIAKTVVLSVRIRGITFRRKVDPRKVVKENSTDPDYLHVSKDLFKRKEIKAITSLADTFKRWLKTRETPTEARGQKLLGGGNYLLNLAVVDEVNAEITRLIQARTEAVEKFLAVPLGEDGQPGQSKYEVLQELAKDRLKENFDQSEYPSAQRLREAFSIEYRYLTFNVPAALQEMNREIYQQESRRIRQEFGDVGRESAQALRVRTQELLDYMVDRLGVQDDGKNKVFQEKTMKKMRELFALIKMQDVTNDTQLQALVQQSLDVLDGVKITDLRTSPATRAESRASFERIKASLDVLIIDKPRTVNLDDEGL